MTPFWIGTGTVLALGAWGSPVLAADPALPGGSTPGTKGADSNQVPPPGAVPEPTRFVTLTAVGGWGAALTRVHRVDIEPFGFGGGGRFDFTMKLGLRLGLYGIYFAGGQREQSYRFTRGGDAYPVTVAAHTVVGGVSIGFDDVVGPVVLRYSLDIGVTRMSWDFADTPYIPGVYRTRTGTLSSLHLAPGLGVLIPLGKVFQVSADFRQHLDSSELVPVGILLYVGAGLRF